MPVLFVSNHQTYFADVIAYLHVFCSVKWNFRNDISNPVYLLNPVTNTSFIAAQETMKSMGKYKNIQADPKKTTWENDVLESSGTVIFENGTKQYHFRMVKVGNTYKVDKLTLE